MSIPGLAFTPVLCESCIIFSKKVLGTQTGQEHGWKEKAASLKLAPSSIYYFSAVYLYDQLIFLSLNVLKISVNS